MHLLIKVVRYILDKISQEVDSRLALRRRWGHSLVQNKIPISESKLLLYVVHIHGCFIPKFIVRNVNYWREKGFIPVVVTTFSNVDQKLLAEEFERVFTDTSYILRLNVGKDFGGIGDALQELDLRFCNEFIVMNDSYIGPFYETNFYEKLRSVDSDVVGVTESFDVAYHLQSSFLYFKNKIAISCFDEFFKKEYKLYELRGNIILKGEIGLTQFLLSKGLKLRAMFPLQILCAKYRVDFSEVKFHKINSQHMYVEKMFVDEGFPYLKREALTKNQTGLAIDLGVILNKMDASSKDELNEALISRI